MLQFSHALFLVITGGNSSAFGGISVIFDKFLQFRLLLFCFVFFFFIIFFVVFSFLFTDMQINRSPFELRLERNNNYICNSADYTYLDAMMI